MKQLFLLLFISLNIWVFSQEELVWENILIEDFDNNNNNWYIGSDKLRVSTISNGVLTDWFGKAGYSHANRISINLNPGSDYKISFSISNLNGDADKKYRVYEEKSDGTIGESWVNYPIWGFIWGFKDWDNYNCIAFKHNREYEGHGDYKYSTYIKIFYEENGQTTTLLDWEEYEYWGTDPIEFNIEQHNGNNVKIYAYDGEVIYRNRGNVFQWYGNTIGPLIGAGAKVEVDYIYVKKRKPHENSNFNETSLKSFWKSNGADKREGIYVNFTNPQNKLALKKSNVGYILIYLSGARESGWRTGDIKAYLSPTAISDLFKGIGIMDDKSVQDHLYIGFDGVLMEILWADEILPTLYLKLFPTENDNIIIRSDNQSKPASGTGFAISSNGILATSFHLIEGATTIKVRGINSDFKKTYKAKVLVSDRNNDLALIQIDDASFTSLGTIPYTIKTSLAGVGESIFVLGYPLRATMGDEIKLTNGIISSRTGFQGDITTYQISAPVQPGNSGGPLFDSQGNLIGIIKAKHVEAENTSYAVKASYLMNLIDLLPSAPKLQTVNSLTGKTLTQQVELAKKFVYIIETE